MATRMQQGHNAVTFPAWADPYDVCDALTDQWEPPLWTDARHGMTTKHEWFVVRDPITKLPLCAVDRSFVYARRVPALLLDPKRETLPWGSELLHFTQSGQAFEQTLQRMLANTTDPSPSMLATYKELYGHAAPPPFLQLRATIPFDHENDHAHVKRARIELDGVPLLVELPVSGTRVPALLGMDIAHLLFDWPRTIEDGDDSKCEETE